MPTYEYECSKCGETFEILQSMKDASLTDCPNKACKGKKTLKRLIGAGAGFIFKGSGFYQTDYKKSGGGGSGNGGSGGSGGSTSSEKSDAGSTDKKSDSAPAKETKSSGGGCGCGGGTCGH